jgi:predicted kinase
MMADIRGSKPFDPSTDARDVGIATTIKHHGHLLSNVDGVDEYALKEHIFGRYPLWQEKPDLPVIYVMIGLPGSGKDTWISKNVSSDDVVICRDDIRAELGLCAHGEKIVGTREQEEIVSKIFNKKLIDAAESSKNIVINNINLKKKYRDAYRTLLKKYKYYWVYQVIEAPTLADNIQRRDGQINKEVFTNMILAFDWPTCDEYDVINIKKQ